MRRPTAAHLVRAKDFADRGDVHATKAGEFYAKAADEVIAARAEEPLTWPEIAKKMGRSQTWCREIVTARQLKPAETSIEVKWSRGSHATTAEIRQGAKKLLAEAPMEQVERLLDDLPRDRLAAIGSAAGDEYMGRRHEYDEEQRSRTPAQEKELEATKSRIDTHVRTAISGLASMSIADHLDTATEMLNELVVDHSVSKEVLRVILKADGAWRAELEVAAAMAGIEV